VHAGAGVGVAAVGDDPQFVLGGEPGQGDPAAAAAPGSVQSNRITQVEPKTSPPLVRSSATS
jgi:hypothetical protein